MSQWALRSETCWSRSPYQRKAGHRTCPGRTPSRGRTPPRPGGSRRSGPPTPAPARRRPRRAAPRPGPRRAGQAAHPAAGQRLVVRVVGGDPGDELLEVGAHQLDTLVDRCAREPREELPLVRGQAVARPGRVECRHERRRGDDPGRGDPVGVHRGAGQGVRAAHRHAEHGEPVDAEQVGDGHGVVRDREVAGRGGVGAGRSPGRLTATRRTPSRRAASSPGRAASRVSGQPWKNSTAGPVVAPPCQRWARRPSGSRTTSGSVMRPTAGTACSCSRSSRSRSGRRRSG